MSRVEGRERRAIIRWRPRTLAVGMLVGLIVVSMGGLTGLFAVMAITRQPLRELPVMSFLVFFPTFGCAAGYGLWRQGRLADSGGGDEAARADSAEAEELRQARR